MSDATTINVQSGGDITGLIGQFRGPVTVGQIGDSTTHVAGNVAEPIPDVRLVNERSAPLKALWATWVTAIGFIGSVASIVSYVRQYGFFSFLHNADAPEWALWLGIPCAILFPFVLGFYRGKRLSIGRHSVGITPDGYLSYGQVAGTCPTPTAAGPCGGTLRIRVDRSGGASQSVLVCGKYPQRHRFPFYSSELKHEAGGWAQ